ncbi:GNAT family N-acetyltransferase [Lentzea tibetensis]|uniref:GNAT family N-acetyltransferase n=1 Tax=Lentzea tibetensis TaxID=2591470 RepID=A0A563EZ48_9PSEU|nr:GNAT family N-acetyltransferase [Lentzea tibetensis]
MRALKDAPHAFYWPIEVEESVSVAEWELWAGAGRVMYVVEEESAWLGMAGCILRGDVLDATGMWVVASARGRGFGEELISAIIAWGLERGASSMRFAVTETNSVAITLYTRLGFQPTGERRALASDPSLTGIFMAKPIFPPRST